MPKSDILADIDSLPDPAEPIPLRPASSMAQPYPVDALPPIMREAALCIAEVVQAPLPLASMVVLGAATTLAQCRVNAPDCSGKPEGQPCSLFMLTIAESGDRKSTCRRLAFHVIDEQEHQLRTSFQQEKRRIDREASKLKGQDRQLFLDNTPYPADPQSQFTDATFEPLAGKYIRGLSAATLDTDEGGQFFGGASMKAEHRTAIIGGYVKLFDTGHVERTRSANNAEGSGVAYHRRLSIIQLAQRVAVQQALNDPLLSGQGLLPRFCFCDTDSLAGTRFITSNQPDPYAEPRLQCFWERCHVLAASSTAIDPETGEILAPVIPLTKDAEHVLIDRYNSIEFEQRDLGRYRNIRPFASRATELALRLSAVMAFFSGDHVITARQLQNAYMIIEHSLSEWLRYKEEAQPSPDIDQAESLFRWIIDPKRADQWQSFDKHQLGKQGPTRSNAKLRDRLLKILLDHRYVRTDDNVYFRVNPVAAAGYADVAEEISPGVLLSGDYMRINADKDNHDDFSAEYRKNSVQDSLPDTPCSSDSADSAPYYTVDSDGAYF